MECFYSKLSVSNIKNEDYEYAKNTCQHLKLQEYAELIFSKIFVELFKNTYNLDPAQYHTAPSLSFDAMFK